VLKVSNDSNWNEMRASYTSDLSDAQWEELETLVVFGTGRPPCISRREILNAIFYVQHTGCQWRDLPHDLPNWSTVYSCFHRWSWNGTLDKIHAALRDHVRKQEGKEPQPTAGSFDSQSVKSTAPGTLWVEGTRFCCNVVTTGPSA